MSALFEYYKEKVVPAMMEKYKYDNVMQVPRMVKVAINRGAGDAILNIKLLDTAVSELTAIAGQKAVVRRAKKSISNFKLRANMPIACTVTLRREKMYEVIYKLVNIVLPRVRDFRGLTTKSFDGRGNYSLGLTEQLIFPEVSYDKVEKVRGMTVTIVTSAETDEEARELLRLLGMPFKE